MPCQILRKGTPLPKREEFCRRYFRLLRSHAASDPTIRLILATQARRDQCASLFWNCVNDAPQQQARLSARRRAEWTTRFETAISGIDAALIIERESSLPYFAEFAEFMGRLRNDLLVKQQRLSAAFPPPQARGRNGRDWSAVFYAQRMLEGHLNGEQISVSTLATLLDAALECADRKQTVTPDAVRLGLERLVQRLPIIPIALSKFYPRGEKFPTQLP